MRRRLESSGHDPEAGVAIVEFALILPLLLGLIFFMIDFGKGVNYWIDETHLASEGARLAAVNKAPGGSLESHLRAQADTEELRMGGTSSVPDPVDVSICFPDGTSNVGDAVQVTVSVNYNWMPFVADFLDKPELTTTTIRDSATMRLEAKPTNYTGGPCPA